MAGTIGAIFNGALQLGSAVGIAAVGSITTSVQETHGTQSYAGEQAAFWFLLGVVGLEWAAMLVFYRTKKEAVVRDANSVAETKMTAVEEKLSGDEKERADVFVKVDAEQITDDPRMNIAELRMNADPDSISPV